MPWFPVLLVAHIALAISLLLPSLVLPFLLRGSEPDGSRRPGRLASFLLNLQGTGSVVIGAGLAITGAGLLVVLGPDLLRKPWLLAALSIYAANLLVAGLVSRPRHTSGALVRAQFAAQPDQPALGLAGREVHDVY